MPIMARAVRQTALANFPPSETTKPMRDFNRDWALRLAEASLSVFPCGADKKPLIKGWNKLSSCNPDAVNDWWHRFPNALPAIDLAKADLVVLDGDRHGGPDGRAALRELLCANGFNPNLAPTILTPGDGVHVYLAQNGHELTNSRGDLPDGIDIRGHGGFVVGGYSILPDGRRYQAVAGTPDLIHAYKTGIIPHVPEFIVAIVQRRAKPEATPRETETSNNNAGARERAYAQAALDGLTTELSAASKGSRNEKLNATAYRLGRMVARGWIDRATVEAELLKAMHANGYVAEESIRAVEATLKSGIDAGVREPHPDLRDEPEAKAAPQEQPQPCTLAEVHASFKKWLGDEYDLDAANAAIAAAASERLAGDPLWLLVIAGPGGAKTETVQSLIGAGAHVTSTIASEGALLSATPQRERNKRATGGLLRKIGNRGVLVIKDVTSILSADRNTRISVLAAIREIYDGRWERNVGTDGGATLTWTGRIVIVGAVTTAWDAAHAVVATMGDRFVLLRPRTHSGRKNAGLGAIRNTGDEAAMRKELATVVGGVIAHMDTTEHSLTDAEVDQLLKAADIVTMARSAVERDYRGEIAFAHDPEMPTRFAKQLVQLLRGGVAIGMTPADAMRLALRCARDSIPPLRREILLDLANNPDSRTAEVRKRISKPRNTVRRELECLHMLGLLSCDETEEFGKDGKEHTIWRYRLADDYDEETLRTMASNPPQFRGRLL